jgi:hypothetical protein
MVDHDNQGQRQPVLPVRINSAQCVLRLFLSRAKNQLVVSLGGRERQSRVRRHQIVEDSIEKKKKKKKKKKKRFVFVWCGVRNEKTQK